MSGSSPVRLVVLDLDDSLDLDSLASFLPGGRRQMPPLLASAFDAPRVVRQGGAKSPVDWDGVAGAIARLVADARESGAGRDVEYYIAGRAPLPVFAQLGFELSAFTLPPTLLNRRKDGQWDSISLAAQAGGMQPSFFLPPTGFPTHESEASGRVAVFVSTKGDPAPRAEIRRLIQSRGEAVAGIVELVTPGPGLLTRANGGSAAAEVEACVSRIPGCFPHSSGLALFLALPSQMAFMAGRAVNAHMVRDVWVPEFDAGTYEPAITLPWRPRTPLLSRSDADVGARQAVLHELHRGLEDLRGRLSPDMLQPLMTAREAEALVGHVQSLQVAQMPEGDSFRLRVVEDRVSFGHGLLDALRGESPDVLRRAVAIFLVHEVYHVGQGLQSTNFAGIGRAGVALEEVDYWADAVAISAATKDAIQAGVAPAAALVAHLEASLRCTQAFDRAEHGPRIERLAERRLRRYLIWHLQLARARTIRYAEDVDALFADRILAELAPLTGWLDARFDKVVKSAPTESGLAIVVGRKLIRHYARPDFAPTMLVEAVRVFDWKVLQAAFEQVIDEHARLLIPWRAEPP
jgi:hypothetical protein